MRELIEKLCAATAPSDELEAIAMVSLFGGEAIRCEGMHFGTGAVVKQSGWKGDGDDDFSSTLRLTRSIDDLNTAFERVLPGCGRITVKGRVSENKVLYGCQIFSTDFSTTPLGPIGEGEHGIEAYAYLIAMLQAVEAKREISPAMSLMVSGRLHLTQPAADARPKNCRNRLKDERKAYPKSGCFSCGNGGLFGCPHERGAA